MSRNDAAKVLWPIVAAHIGTLMAFTATARVVSSEWFHSWISWNVADWMHVAVSIFLAGLAMAQVAMLGAVTASSSRPILFRLRWQFRLLLLQWSCLTIPAIGAVQDWEFPLSIVLVQLLIAVPSFLVAGLVRLLSGRVLVSTSNPDQSSLERNQFAIADLLVLTTCVAVSFGVIRLFPHDANGLEGIVYAVIVVGGVFVGIPTGVLVPLLAWGFFAERDRPAENCRRWWIGLIGIALTGIPVSVIGGFGLPSDDGIRWALFLFGVLTALFATFITAIYFRKQGYRFQRQLDFANLPRATFPAS